MFIEDTKGNLVNTRHIIAIFVSEPYLEQKTYNVVAEITSGGTVILSKHETERGARQFMNKYHHMD